MSEGRAGRTHRLPVRIYYEDTDAGGVVYHASYLRFAERARTEMLRETGGDTMSAMRRDGLAFVVRRCSMRFRRPARLDDLVEVRSRVTGVAGASVEFEQDVYRGEEQLVSVALQIACVNDRGRPVGLPQALRAGIASAAPPATEE